jgi:aspartate/methionine/tyrosine aminotransferase
MADEECTNIWANLRLGYTETRGMPLLRDEIAKSYAGLDGNNILCFAGAEEGIYCTFKTLLSAADHAIVLTPCYQSLKSIPETLCEISTLDLTASSGWSLDVNAVRKLVRPGQTKLIACNFPHNPTGTSITPEVQQQLVALAREFGLWLFCDEVYRGVERELDEAGQSKSLPPIATVYEKAISLSAVSKVQGLAGLRIGWICCADLSTVCAIADNKHYLSICNSGPSEVLALIALRAKDKVIGRNMQIIRTNEAYLAEFMRKYPNLLSWTPPKGGCCGFMHINLPESVDLAEVTERLVQQHGVLILPGENFPITSEGNVAAVRKHFRVGLGRAAFPRALDAFEAALPQVLQSMGVSMP